MKTVCKGNMGKVNYTILLIKEEGKGTQGREKRGRRERPGLPGQKRTVPLGRLSSCPKFQVTKRGSESDVKTRLEREQGKRDGKVEKEGAWAGRGKIQVPSAGKKKTFKFSGAEEGAISRD